jgi:hypothetical protein
MVETGTPLENLFRTTNGGPMATVAAQAFKPPIDLTRCGQVLVAVATTEVTPVLASMLLVAEGRVEDGGTDVLGMKQAREESLVFQVPVTAGPLLVQEIRIMLQSPFQERDQNVRIAVVRFTLTPRGR